MNRRQFRVAEMAAIQCPTLIITGEEDTAQPPRNSESLAAGIRDARIVTFPAPATAALWSRRQAAIAAMRELFQSVSANKSAVEPSNGGEAK